MKLQESLKGLILEIASIESVVDSIKRKQVIVLYYTGDAPGGDGLRTIEPVCLGVSKAGNKVLRAWDYEGASHTATLGTQPLPGWRLFRLDKITSYKPNGQVFNEMRPNFNPNGDKSMVSIITLANFGQPAQPSIIPQELQQPQQTPETPETPQVNTDEIINKTIDSLTTEFTQKYGEGGFDLSKSAEAFKRIYAAIESETKNRLTDAERATLRTTITNKLQK
jgi:hypothetical protein